VFLIRCLIAWFVSPLAMLIAGPLAVLFNWLVGAGPGSGISVIFVVCGILASLVGLAGYLIPVIRGVESILPDHDVSAGISQEVLQAVN
jgi:hypothetical protein